MKILDGEEMRAQTVAADRLFEFAWQFVTWPFRGQVSYGHTAFGAAKGVGLNPIDRPSPVVQIWKCR